MASNAPKQATTAEESVTISEDVFSDLKRLGMADPTYHTGKEILDELDKKIQRILPSKLSLVYPTEVHYAIAKVVHDMKGKQFDKSALLDIPELDLAKGIFKNDKAEREVFYKKLRAHVESFDVVADIDGGTQGFSDYYLNGSSWFLCKRVSLDDGNGGQAVKPCVLIPLEMVSKTIMRAYAAKVGYTQFRLLDDGSRTKQELAYVFIHNMHVQLKYKGIYIPEAFLKELLVIAEPASSSVSKKISEEEKKFLMDNLTAMNSQDSKILGIIDKSAESTLHVARNTPVKRAIISKIAGIDFYNSPPASTIGSPNGLSKLVRNMETHQFKTPSK